MLAYVDDEGVPHYNVYSPKYNCRFPRQLRVPGRYYAVPTEDVTLSTRTGTPFYTIKVKRLQTIEDEVETRVYRVEDCVVCMDASANVVFRPCGHQCVCDTCCAELSRRKRRVCPLCRQRISLNS